MDQESEKLDALSERIRQAKAGAKPESEKNQASARNSGFDFAGSVIGAGVIGFFLDRTFGTAPWCLVGMVVLGFVGGMASAWSAMQKTRSEGK
jgi:ATP synthase protein I